MKLVEILAKELDVWPQDAAVMSQDKDMTVYAWSGAPDWDSIYNDEWLTNDNAEVMDSVNSYELATDYSTAIITREMWEAERNGGWIAWGGGECPGEPGSDVSVKFDDGDIARNPEGWRWQGHCGWRNIVAYRLHKPAQQEKEEMTPYTHRDIIIHCQAIIEDCQREIEKSTEALAKEGFELIAYSVKEQDAVPDMTDWRDWKEGDLVKCIVCPSKHGGFYIDGGLYYVSKVDVEETDFLVQVEIESYKNVSLWNPPSCFKWHSRP